MINLTEAQILAAKNNELEAVTAVVNATEDRIQQLAWKYATSGGRADQALAEDLAQNGRIAVWECLSRFSGTTVAEFFTYVDRTLKGVMSDSRKTATRQGVSRSVAAAYECALSMADGDPYAAEHVAADPSALGDRRLSPETAYAARLSYQGVEYLDAPVGQSEGGETFTLADTLAAEAEVPADLLEAGDYERERRKRTSIRVRRTLARMSWEQSTVLMALTGIVPISYYGTERDDELAADYGLRREQVRIIRSKAKDRFARLWDECE
ncbi:sigma factor [Streptomyces sp. A1-5]|uniref:sigma factor n=1 Tax=Streptomyces sp. A1-5 TaxID=2738410 RepID=UPI001F1CA6F7|nr:sigma factor [Streptomyces sp. A1-5]UJB43618.1 helix-turn-helix domain-containing protein [Streptomyces sp. A1-5]